MQYRCTASLTSLHRTHQDSDIHIHHLLSNSGGMGSALSGFRQDMGLFLLIGQSYKQRRLFLGCFFLGFFFSFKQSPPAWEGATLDIEPDVGRRGGEEESSLVSTMRGVYVNSIACVTAGTEFFPFLFFSFLFFRVSVGDAAAGTGSVCSTFRKNAPLPLLPSSGSEGGECIADCG